MDKVEVKRITQQQDVNDLGQPIFRPPEQKSLPIKRHWRYVWIAVIVIVILAWAFLFWYFSNHHAPYSAW